MKENLRYIRRKYFSVGERCVFSLKGYIRFLSRINEKKKKINFRYILVKFWKIKRKNNLKVFRKKINIINKEERIR